MTVFDVLATVRLRPVHVVLGAVIGIGCGKERPFSTGAAQLEGSPSPTSQPGAAPSPSDASASVGDPEATNCSDVDCPLSAGGNDRSQSPSACSTNEDCPNGSTPACDLATGSCVPCLIDSDCAPEKPFCRQTSATSAGNVCVQCTGDAQCPESSPVCDLGSNQCTSRCQGSAQCSGATPICDPVQRVCVQCQSSVDCSAPAPACDAATSRCVECLDDSTCAPGRFCIIQSHSCVGCLDTSQCTDAFNAHCQTDPLGPNPFTCTGCVEDRDCANKDGLGSHCRTRDGRCTECITDADCPGAPTTTTCSPEGTCGPCVTDADCATIPDANACLPGIACVECSNDDDCTDNPGGGFCKTSDASASSGDAPLNTCVDCTSNDGCVDPAGALCQNDTCVPCQANADCSHLSTVSGSAQPPLAICDAGRCVQCTGLQKEACGAGVCDGVTKQCTMFPAGSAALCEPCVSDEQCSLDGSIVCARDLFGMIDLGFRCFPATGVDQGNPQCRQTPFSEATDINTVDGQTRSVCLLGRTTCTGLQDAVSSACTTDDDCGVGDLDDGRCLNGVCSIPCSTEQDCFDPTVGICLGGTCQL